MDTRTSLGRGNTINFESGLGTGGDGSGEDQVRVEEENVELDGWNWGALGRTVET